MALHSFDRATTAHNMKTGPRSHPSMGRAWSGAWGLLAHLKIGAGAPRPKLNRAHVIVGTRALV